MCGVPCSDRDTQRVYRLYDFTKAQLIRPNVAYCVAGKVNSADKLYLVIESVRRTPNTSGFPLLLFLLTAREGCLCPKTLLLGKPAPGTHAFAPPPASLRTCAPTTKPAHFLTTKPAKMRSFYSGANT